MSLCALCQRFTMFGMMLVSAGLAAADHDQVRVEVINLQGPVLAVTAPSASQADPDLRRQLQTRISVAFDGVPLDQAARRIAQLAGVNVVVHPNLIADAPVIDLQLDQATTASVVEWLATLSGATVSLHRGAVFFSDQPVRGASETRLYRVADLASPLSDFPGPDMALTAGGDGQGIHIFDLPGADNDAGAIDADDLAEMIEDHFNR